MNKKGFTLTELLIVVAIISVLVLVSIPVFAAQVERSNESADIDNMKAAKDVAIAQYHSGVDLKGNILTKDGFTCNFDASSGILTSDRPSGYGRGTEVDAGCEDFYMVVKPTNTISQVAYTSKTNVEGKYIGVFIDSEGTIKTEWLGGKSEGEGGPSASTNPDGSPNSDSGETSSESGYTPTEGAIEYIMNESNRYMVGYTSKSYTCDKEFEYDGKKYYFGGFDHNALKGYSGVIKIPESVWFIADSAFQNTGSISGFDTGNNKKFITLNDGKILANASVTKLYKASYKLGNYDIPSTVTTICDGAFKGCSAYLKNLTIPNSVTYIGNEAFYDCTNLTNITIPGSVKTIKICTIYNISNSVNVVLEEGVETIEGSAIYAKTLNVSLPSTLKNMGSTSLKLVKSTNTFSGTFKGVTYTKISEIYAAVKKN